MKVILRTSPIEATSERPLLSTLALNVSHVLHVPSNDTSSSKKLHRGYLAAAIEITPASQIFLDISADLNAMCAAANSR